MNTIKRNRSRKCRKGNARKSKKYGGWFGMFNSTPDLDKSRDAVPGSNGQKVGIQRLMVDQTQLQNRVDNAYMGSATTAVASGVITTLAASGVGMPVAALLAGALLISSKLFDLIRGNLMLRLLMKDVIFIIMDCYLLFRLIEKSYVVIGQYDDPDNNCPYKKKQLTETPMQGGGNGRTYQINKIMQDQLNYQIKRLIKILMHLIDTNNLKILKDDPALSNNAFGEYLTKEYTIREKESGVTGYFSMSKITRNYDRKFGGLYYITEINNIITIINSYIVLLKSNLDTVLKKFEILTPVVYKDAWGEILCSTEYNAYIKPVIEVTLKVAATDATHLQGKQLSEDVSRIVDVGPPQ